MDNRVYKFRAWEKNRKEMLEVEGIFFDVGTIKHKLLKVRGNTNPFNDGYPNTYFKDIELMQFTGLKDKNGKEIYEGDIVKEIWSLHPVEWSIGDCGFRPFTGARHLNSLTSEVIGNIWENPELLKE